MRQTIAALMLFLALPLFGELRQIYKLSFSVTPAADRVTIDLDVLEKDSDKLVASRVFQAKPGEWSSATIPNGPHQIELRAQGKSDGSATLFITVKDGGQDVQRNLYTYTPTATQTKDCGGDGISIELKDADLRDVMRTFAALSKETIEVDKDVDAKITVSLRSVPWEQALRTIARQHKLKVVYEGETIRITR